MRYVFRLLFQGLPSAPTLLALDFVLRWFIYLFLCLFVCLSVLVLTELRRAGEM